MTKINEMAYIGKCNGSKVVVNSNDHGKPHFHYGDYKVFIPEKANSIAEILINVDKSQRDKISTKELKDLLKFLNRKNTISSKFGGNLTNLQVIAIQWKVLHKQ
jgi:hypothetical protein